MPWIFKNHLGAEISISDAKLEEHRNNRSIPPIGFTIPEIDDNSYHLDRYEED